MTDDDFVQAFLSGSLPNAQFHHRDHLRLAWALIRLTGEEQATTRITSGIRYFATMHGQAEKYHETMTRFWVRIVGHAVAARDDAQPGRPRAMGRARSSGAARVIAE